MSSLEDRMLSWVKGTGIKGSVRNPNVDPNGHCKRFEKKEVE